MLKAISLRARRPLWIAGGGLLALLLLTWAVRGLWTWQAEQHAPARQKAAAAAALTYAHGRFEAVQDALLSEAQALAEDPAVMRGLRAVAAGDGAPEALVQRAATWPLPKRTAVEVYTPTPQLVAWSGFSMPLDNAPDAPQFMEDPQTTVVRDGDVRLALVAWWPVRDGARAIGAVRTLRLIRFRTSIQNQYLQDYSLADEWSQAAGLPVEINLWADAAAQLPDSAAGDTEANRAPRRVQLLEGAGGRVLGRLSVTAPPAQQVVQQGRLWFSDLMALWATGVLVLCVAGLWGRYRAVGRAPAAVSAGTSVHAHLRRAAVVFALMAVAALGLRYALLAMNVPARWQSGEALLAPLFDFTHLASPLAGGFLRSAGDLLITGGFAFLLAVAFLDLAARFRNKGAGIFQLRERLAAQEAEQPSLWRFGGVLAAALAVALSLAVVPALVARRAVLDSTLDYLARTGLLPDPLVLAVFCGLLMITIAAVLLIAGVAWIALWMLLRYWPGDRPAWAWMLVAVGAVAAPLALGYGALGLDHLLNWSVALAVLLVGGSIAAFGFVRRGEGLELLTLRRLLPAILLVTVVLYPMLYRGMSTQRRDQMTDAATSFGDGRDPRAHFSVQQVLADAEADAALANALANVEADAARAQLDSLATGLLRGSLLSSLGAYRASLTFFDATGRPVGGYAAALPGARRAAERADLDEYSILRQMYADSRTVGPMVVPLTGRRDRDRFQYAGLAPVHHGSSDTLAGWVMARAEPQRLAPDAGAPFPRALLPSGYYGDLYVSLSLAEFRGGALVRSLGRDFGRYRLADDVREALVTQPALWRTEEVKGRAYLTYYQRQEAPAPVAPTARMARPATASVTAVRVPAITTFDHLYYMLRLAVAGLCIGVPLYLGGLFVRWQKGRLPAPQVRFRDKVLNAFLAVGTLSVVLVGLVGVRLLRGENERATQDWLRQRLEQVEETLAMAAEGNELPYRTVQRLGLDALATRSGLDLNLYEGERLIATSRPRLVREQLIDGRLPVEAYEALYFDGYRFTTTRQEIGRFPYTAGFRALPDEQGRPRFVLSAPTLPEQERIAEEQARTTAYLFGALLLLVVVVMFTASLLAGALARPIARLRAGLEAVGRGRFARRLPVDTRDEIGELVQTFNEMRDQLAESRRKLAQQERELAWREMARQVAHEIKNPLTPMKLSVQHLRRAYERLEVPGQAVPAGSPPAEGDDEAGRFRTLFERITGTLIEQIDALARIANEFHSFARLPTRVLEPLDLNAVLREAVSLMQEEANAEIALDLHAEPLVVEADQEELRRIYINLIKNALQAIPEEGQGLVRVATRVEEVDGALQAHSTVADNGGGIPADVRDKIFQPNFSTKNSGTGLGLAICRKGVEEMGGAIGFETDEGAGTTFWIRLPLVEE